MPLFARTLKLRSLRPLMQRFIPCFILTPPFGVSVILIYQVFADVLFFTTGLPDPFNIQKSNTLTQFLLRSTVATIWSSIMAFFFWVIWRDILLQRRLLKYGIRTSGAITEILVESRGSRSYGAACIIKYTHDSVAGEMVVDPARASGLKGGGAVTVFFDEKEPKSSVIYECCYFEVN